MPSPQATSEDPARTAALLKLVEAVTSRGLASPALFVLEVARPFQLLIQQAMLLAQPVLQPWLGDQWLLWTRLLEDRRTLDQTRDLLAGARQTSAAR